MTTLPSQNQPETSDTTGERLEQPFTLRCVDRLQGSYIVVTLCYVLRLCNHRWSSRSGSVVLLPLFSGSTSFLSRISTAIGSFILHFRVVPKCAILLQPKINTTIAKKRGESQRSMIHSSVSSYLLHHRQQVPVLVEWCVVCASMFSSQVCPLDDIIASVQQLYVWSHHGSQRSCSQCSGGISLGLKHSSSFSWLPRIRCCMRVIVISWDRRRHLFVRSFGP